MPALAARGLKSECVGSCAFACVRMCSRMCPWTCLLARAGMCMTLVCACVLAHLLFLSAIVVLSSSALVCYVCWCICCSILPIYTLAMCCDPELAIARAKANQDHQPHRPDFAVVILILNLAKANRDQQSPLGPRAHLGPGPLGPGPTWALGPL